MMLLAYMMLLHFVADFLMQSREMGQKKSTEFKWLFRHLETQFLMFAFGLTFLIGPVLAFTFAALNTIIHGVIDWYIWRGYKLSVWVRTRDTGITKDQLAATWKYWEDHWFYSTIGFDQLLHILTIIFLFGVLL